MRSREIAVLEDEVLELVIQYRKVVLAPKKRADGGQRNDAIDLLFKKVDALITARKKEEASNE